MCTFGLGWKSVSRLRSVVPSPIYQGGFDCGLRDRRHDALRESPATGRAGGEHRLPMACSSRIAASGCLMTYSTRLADVFRRAAVYVDKIQRRHSRATCRLSSPRSSSWSSLKTAKSARPHDPPSVLARADQVIE